jgi:hypothetical protein
MSVPAPTATGKQPATADDLLSLDELERLHILRVLEACDCSLPRLGFAPSRRR